MLATVLISLGFLFLIGLIMIKGSYERLNNQDIPPVYQHPTVNFILRLSIFLFIGYAGFFIFYDWKLFLVLLVVGILTARFTTVVFWDVVFGALFGDKNARVNVTKKRKPKKR
ncbi:hypothetical protein [Desulforamulus ferrireducens]|uniref:Uncharacterized protein n=1 Tax=Desulforamulus ferrireducens TaxID=1833852 RepID=A0A1S6IWN9_9FIRM|nr:hypothetical protein [Desulforamulus ferrireducens]AQS59187.1 hypothetical protein B0537_08915 [Desulforamulus ferrireducens]